MLYIKMLLSILLLGTTLSVAAQTRGFDLFEPDRGQPKTEPPSNPVPQQTAPAVVKPPPPPPALSKPQQDFALKGTSRIGDKRAAVLQGPDGKEFLQTLDNNERTPLKGYSGYFLERVDRREVRILYPIDAPCLKANESKGVGCFSDRIALVKLQHSEALAPPPPKQPPQPFQDQSAPLTMEEAQQREEELRKRQELYKNFQRQVIRDEDVPPGMRVVRTPFGDRLVPVTPQ